MHLASHASAARHRFLMDNPTDIDLQHVARDLGLTPQSVQRTVELLDDGNTVPFVTRFRKDQTGALNEHQIRQIQEKVGNLRAVESRKQTVLKSIQAQGKLSESLAHQIQHARSPKRLEDLYLPFKPKKQTLATLARKRGLEPLAREVLQAAPAAADLNARAAELVDPSKDLQSVDEVLHGIGHLLAEWMSERADVRGKLRKILHRTGKLLSSRIDPAPKEDPPKRADPGTPATEARAEPTAEPTITEKVDPEKVDPEKVDSVDAGVPDAGPTSGPNEAGPNEAGTEPQAVASNVRAEGPTAKSAQDDPERSSADTVQADTVQADTEQADTEQADTEQADTEQTDAEQADTEQADTEQTDAVQTDAVQTDAVQTDAEQADAEQADAEQADAEQADTVQADTVQADAVQTDTEQADAEQADAVPKQVDSPTPEKGVSAAVVKEKSKRSPQKKGSGKTPLRAKLTKKEKKRQRLQEAFKDYFDFREAISRIPPHRVLAINRGERARILRVKIEGDIDAMTSEAEQLTIPEDHPHRDYLRTCLRDALSRLLLPSLERELRREMTDRAETHAVNVFAQNLRKLLLQPRVQSHRVLAIDPGFRSGCKMVAIDAFGNVLGHDLIHVIGKDEWLKTSRRKLAEMVEHFDLTVVAIGNGTACRETERLVVDVINDELKERDVSFVMVNEAGASVYSTSPLGREELPEFDPVLRSAISIGRRLLDPLSELVKINPANIGVGMYQHDVRANHLRDSLDAVVESCVNYVGVDVNTASPALLRYVSGLNQLTARRLFEYRREHGPFRSREQFKEVPGFGEATFVQAAGFLKITGADQPLDATWIHPESYDLARCLLEKLGRPIAVDSPADDGQIGTHQPERSEFGGQNLEPGQADETAPVNGGSERVAEQPTGESPEMSDPQSDVPASKSGDPVPESDGTDVSSNETPSSDSEERETEIPRADASEADGSRDEKSGSDLSATEESGAETAEAETAGAETVGADGTGAEVSSMSAADETVGQRDGTLLEEIQAEPGASSTTSEPAAEEETEQAGETQIDEAVAGQVREKAAAVGDEDAAGSDRVPQRTAPVAASFHVTAEEIASLALETLTDELGASQVVLSDILAALARPGRDPREDLPAPIFRRGILKLEDLKAGMELSGTVLNVVDFGAFVDIGLPDSGLVHISRLADRYVKDPHEVISVGDVLKVWVVDIDKQRRRVSLTAIQPGTEKPQPARRRGTRGTNSSEGRQSEGRQAAGRGKSSGGGSGGGGQTGRRGGRRGSGERGPGRRGGSRAPRQHTTRQTPKVIKPITKEMEEGAEPLRSFSDLMQFYQKKKTDENDEKK